jgi:hypothetical protein
MAHEAYSPTSKRLPPAVERKRLRGSDVLVRAATAELMRTEERGGMHESVSSTVQRLYGDDPATIAYIQRAAVSPANSQTPTWAAELVGTAVADFVATDMAQSGFAQLAERALVVPFEQGAASVKVPGRASPVALMGAWIGEGNAKPVFAATLTTTTLTPYKLSAVSTFTEEMMMASSIEMLVRETLAHDLAALLDTAIFDATAASAVRPAGLFNGATVVTASATTPLNEAMFADLKALGAAVTGTGNPDATVAFVVNPAQAVRIGILAPNYANLIVTGYMPAGSVGAIDTSAIAMIVSEPAFRISKDATMHMDSVPLPLGTPGSPNVVAAPMSSLFQQDLVGLRCVLRAGWAKRRTTATALATAVTW